MPTWETAVDWDSAQRERGTRHFDDANVDTAGSGSVEKGYPTTDIFGSALETYYPLDEDSGTTVYDAAGTTDATNNGATVGASGLLGTTCYSYDATDDTIDDAIAQRDWSTNEWTIAGWILLNDTSNDHALVAEQRSNDTAQIQLWADAGNSAFAAYLNDAVAYGTTTPSTGTWYFIAIRKNKTSATNSEVNLVVNGSQEADANASLGTDTNYLRIGATGQGLKLHNGKIDEVLYFTRYVTDSELTTYYNAVAGMSTYVSSKKQL